MPKEFPNDKEIIEILSRLMDTTLGCHGTNIGGAVVVSFTSRNLVRCVLLSF